MFLVESILVVAAFLAGVYFAPAVRGDVIKVDDYIKGKFMNDKTAFKAAVQKQIDKL